jgi:hypothetical protein
VLSSYLLPCPIFISDRSTCSSWLCNMKIRAGCKIENIVPVHLHFSIRRMYCNDVTNSRNLPKLNDEKRSRKKSVQTLHTHLLVSIYSHLHYTRFLEGSILIILTMIAQHSVQPWNSHSANPSDPSHPK